MSLGKNQWTYRTNQATSEITVRSFGVIVVDEWIFQYYGRKTKDGAVMSPTFCAGTRVSIPSARARPMAHKVTGEEEKKVVGGWFADGLLG